MSQRLFVQPVKQPARRSVHVEPADRVDTQPGAGEAERRQRRDALASLIVPGVDLRAPRLAGHRHGVLEKGTTDASATCRRVDSTPEMRGVGVVTPRQLKGDVSDDLLALARQ